MNCDSVSKLIPLYFYGEVTPEDEDQVDQHIHECTVCAAQMEQQRAMAALFDQRQAAIPPVLLDECREDLLAAIAGGAPRQVRPSKGPWTLFLEAMNSSFGGFGRLAQPVGALLLVLLGFAAGRFMVAGTTVSSPSADAVATVKDVKADNDGTIHVAYDQTTRHQVAGRLDDPRIENLILAGSRDEDAAVRLESVGLLRSRVDQQPVLDSLLNSLAGDPIVGVRLTALDALKPKASDPRVSKTLSQVLLTDVNPAVRMQVIDVMVSRRDDALVGALQNLMQREDDNGVRLKASKVLKDWNASIGTF
jgi:HEAT repeats/Putative zinc-finger